jgi:Domain of unknown function (DUF4331)
MSHHYSGPDLSFPHGDARLDLTDLYAFPKPIEGDKSPLIMNVHPSAVVNPPESTTREPFAASYEFKIDTNNDAVADIAYRVRFSSSEDGAQTATLRRVEDAEAAGTGRRRPGHHRSSKCLSASRVASLCRAMQLRLSQPSFARHSRVWALHDGGRYEPT